MHAQTPGAEAIEETEMAQLRTEAFSVSAEFLRHQIILEAIPTTIAGPSSVRFGFVYDRRGRPTNRRHHLVSQFARLRAQHRVVPEQPKGFPTNLRQYRIRRCYIDIFLGPVCAHYFAQRS